MTIRNVRGYIDQSGTAHLNLEDVSRGLGFTQDKDGKEYIRWDRVNNYLRELNFPTSGEEINLLTAFIPENVFYRLAMKAKNETAETFQTIVADEILPSIRKTGSYSLQKPQCMMIKSSMH
jgi:prophage antirepressor-like protein